MTPGRSSPPPFAAAVKYSRQLFSYLRVFLGSVLCLSAKGVRIGGGSYEVVGGRESCNVTQQGVKLRSVDAALLL